MSVDSMTSDHPADLLSALLDDELDAAEIAEIEGHLADCSVCRLELAEVESARMTLRRMPTLQAPTDLIPRVVARRRRSSRRGALVGMAAAVVAVVAGVGMADPGGGGEVARPPQPPAEPADHPYTIWKGDKAQKSDPSLVDRAEDAANELLEFFTG
jgi:anti-sigma factor RsiW